MLRANVLSANVLQKHSTRTCFAHILSGVFKAMSRMALEPIELTSSWHRVDSVWHCQIWISIDVSCRKAPTRFRSYKASQSSHASQTLQALQGDYVVTTFQFGVSQLLVLINAMEHSNSWQSVFPPFVALRIHVRFSTGIFWCCVFCLLPPKMLRWSRKQVSKSVFRISKVPAPCCHSSLGRSGRSLAYPCTGLQMFVVLWGLCISPK